MYCCMPSSPTHTCEVFPLTPRTLVSLVCLLLPWKRQRAGGCNGKGNYTWAKITGRGRGTKGVILAPRKSKDINR